MVLGCVLAAWAWAADAPAKPEPQAATAASLRVFEQDVAELRGALFGATPAQRARRDAAMVADIVHQGGAGKVSTQPSDIGNLVLIDGQMAFVLTAADADSANGENLDTLSGRVTERLSQAISAFRQQQHQQTWAENVAIAAAETVAALLAGAVLWKLRRWLRSVLLSWFARQAEHLQVGGTRLIRRDSLALAVRWLVNTVFGALLLLVSYTWLAQVLARFPATRAWGEQFNDYLLELAEHVGRNVLVTVPNLLIAMLTFFIARGVTRLLQPLFEQVASGRSTVGWLDKDTVEPTRRLVTMFIWIFAVVMAYPYLPGAQTEAFKGVSVLLGLMVSLGASSIVGQGASGLILMYTRTLRSGEYVRIGDEEGTVMSIGLFNTRLLTGRGAEVTLPNLTVIGTATKNFSRTVGGQGFMIDTTVSIGYDTPWRQVEAMLIEAARRTPGVLSEPPPKVFQTELADFYPKYNLIAQSYPGDAESRAQAVSRLHASIQDVFNEYGVQIMSPHYLGDPPERKWVPREKWYAPPAHPPTKD